MLEEAQRYNTKDYIASQIAMHGGRCLNQIIKDCANYPNKKLLDKLESNQIKKDYPTISEKDLSKIDGLMQVYLEKYHDKPKAQKAFLEQIQSQLPDIASGKITLPDLPTQDKGKGGR